MPLKSDNSSEMHPHFPSGEWEGFFVYFRGGEQYKMAFHLNFKDGMVTGSGADAVNAFTWKGKYSLEDFTCRMVKSYPTHQVFYDGRADENGIWGLWKMDFFTGGFHIWPKGNGVGKAVEEVEKVSESITV